MLKTSNKSEHTVLSAGSDFFDNLINTITKAQKTIYIQAFLWRNDNTGRLIARALLEAADRGVRVIIKKDRIGAFFEYAEYDGQSFFHDSPHTDSLLDTHSTRTVLIQSKVMAKLYGHTPATQIKNDLLPKLVSHKNIQIQDTHKRYDHSKVIVIDSTFSYIGGIGFGDEFNSGSDSWIDFMFTSSSREVAESLLHSTETQIPDVQVLTNTLCEQNGTSLHDDLLQFIQGTKHEITIAMPFLGNVTYLKSIVTLLKRSVTVNIITPASAHSNRYRNRHFLKRLIREAGISQKYLTLTLTEKMLHAKLIVRDNNSVRIGSQNMVMDSLVVRDTVITSNTPSLCAEAINKLNEQLEQTQIYTQTGYVYDTHHSWALIILPSRLEWLTAKAQNVVLLFRHREIAKIHNS